MTAASSPAAFEASVARDVLEDVLVERLGLATVVAVGEVEARIDEALTSLEALQESAPADPDHLERLELATAQVESVLTRLRGVGATPRAARMTRAVESVLEALEAVREPTIDRVVAVQGARSPRERDQADAPLLQFTPSHGKPALFVVNDRVKPWTSARRQLLRSRVRSMDRAEAPQLAVSTLFAEARALMRDDDRSEVAEAVAVPAPEPFRPALVALRRERHAEANEREQAQLQRLARACLDDIGALGNLRIVRDDELVTKATAGFEERLLARLDALMAFGHTVAGSGARIDVLRYVARHARDAFVDDPFRSFARALVLGCVEGEAAARAATVALQASPANTHRAQAEALALATNPLLDDALRRLAAGEDEELAQVSLDLLWRRGSAQLADALPLAQHPAPAVRAAAARCLGAAPEREAAAATLVRMLEVEVEDSVESSAIEALCMLDLDGGRAALRQRLEEERSQPGRLSPAVRAELLMLIAIAGEEHDGELLAADDPASIEALGWHGDGAHVPRLRALCDAAEPLALAAAASLDRISGAPEAAESFEPGRRYRHGAPFTLRAGQHELLADEVPNDTRERLATELALAGCERIDVHGWVAVQRERLAALTDEALDVVPVGSWLPAD
jgi:hypothetical protein